MKKSQSKTNDATLRFRCRKEDEKAFRAKAEKEGFGGNLTAWILWHLRRTAGLAEKEQEGD